MFLDLDRKSHNACLRFLHLGLQIIGAYWAVVIDGYSCQENYIRNITYIAYGLIGFNLLFSIFFGNKLSNSKFLYYLPLVVNVILSGALLYFIIEGYNKFNTCAPTRVLYEFFFIQVIIALVLFILVMVAKIAWADRYAHWPGNLAWPILFLKIGFQGAYHVPAIVIGVIFLFISVVSFGLNAFHYNTLQIDGSKDQILSGQWGLSMVLMFFTEIFAIVILLTTAKDGEYWWDYGRKIFVVFAAVNIIDGFFWFYGYRRLSAWKLHL